MEFFLHLLLNGLSLGFLYALSALGFVMIYKSSSVLNFAHGELLAIGAFLFLLLSTWAKLPIPLAFALTLAGSFILGFIVERLFLRRMIGEDLIQVIMLTVGLAAMFKGLMLFIFGGDIHQYPKFLPESLNLHIGIIQIPSVYVATFIIGILFLVGLRPVFQILPPRASTCARWPTTSRRPSLWGFTSSGSLPFPGPSPPWWPP